MKGSNGCRPTRTNTGSTPGELVTNHENGGWHTCAQGRDFSEPFSTPLNQSGAFCPLRHHWTMDPNALPKQRHPNGTQHRALGTRQRDKDLRALPKSSLSMGERHRREQTVRGEGNPCTNAFAAWPGSSAGVCERRWSRANSRQLRFAGRGGERRGHFPEVRTAAQRRHGDSTPTAAGETHRDPRHPRWHRTSRKMLRGSVAEARGAACWPLPGFLRPLHAASWLTVPTYRSAISC